MDLDDVRFIPIASSFDLRMVAAPAIVCSNTDQDDKQVSPGSLGIYSNDVTPQTFSL